MIHFIGGTFPVGAAWHNDEVSAIANIRQQIDAKFPSSRNLLINTTWFGPQFNNGHYDRFLQLVNTNQQFDRVFLMATADPVFLNQEQINNLIQSVHAKQIYLLGHFDTDYQFNFHATVLGRYFANYTEDDLLPKDLKKIFLNYNRKPREHRVQLVSKLIENNLDQYGIITLGTESNRIYNKTEPTPGHFIVEDLADFGAQDSMGRANGSEQFGIPDDIHSVGNLNLWQQHFLNIVSETEFLPWDNTFVSEKTWKPILGLRPFVLNGQTKIYKYLQDNGFYTFNHYWPHIKMEELLEFEVHDSLLAVIKFLSTMTNDTLLEMYADMLPALEHNRNRFFEFAKEQQYKIDHLFE